jgi:hypothetical protein
MAGPTCCSESSQDASDGPPELNLYTVLAKSTLGREPGVLLTVHRRLRFHLLELRPALLQQAYAGAKREGLVQRCLHR